MSIVLDQKQTNNVIFPSHDDNLLDKKSALLHSRSPSPKKHPFQERSKRNQTLTPMCNQNLTVFQRAKRTTKSIMLSPTESVETYLKRMAKERDEKKKGIQEEIKEQTRSLSTVYPTLQLHQTLKQKWMKARKKIRLEVKMIKSRKDIKLFGLNYNNKLQREIDQKYFQVEEKTVILKKYMFHPGSKFKSVWSFLLFMLLMYTAYATPIEIAFIDQPSEILIIVEYIFNFLFIVDMIVSINSSYYDPNNNELIQSRKKILHKYLKGWFFIDLMAAFPFELLESQFLDKESSEDETISFRNINSTNFKQLLKLPRIYRLFRLLRLIKIVKKTKTSYYLMRAQEIFNLNSGLISIVNYLIIISVAINLMGCIWFFEAKIRGFEPETWVYELQLQDQDIDVLYTYSIYWAIATLCTVGYGDIRAYNMIERLICIIWMTFGAGFYSYSVGSLSNVITNLDTRKAKLRKKKIIMDEFCKSNQMPKHLQNKIQRALEYACVKSLFTIDEKIEFIRELPTDLKYEISKLSRKSVLRTSPFFKKREKNFISEFVLYLSSFKVPAGEILYEKGQYPNTVYFIMKGKVGMIEGSERMVYKYFVPGGYFGEVEIFAECVRLTTAITIENTEFLTINRHEFEMILKNFPDIFEELKSASEEKQKRTMENLKNIQTLLPLSSKSSFWLKRRRTIRSRKNQLSAKIIDNFKLQPQTQRVTMIWFTIKKLTQPLFKFLGKLKSKLKSTQSNSMKNNPTVVPGLFCKGKTRVQKLLNANEYIQPHELTFHQIGEESKGEQRVSVENRSALTLQSPVFKLSSGRLGNTKSQSPDKSLVQQIVQGHSLSSEYKPIEKSQAQIKGEKEIGERKVPRDFEKGKDEVKERKADFGSWVESIERTERKWRELNEKTEEIQGKLLEAQELLRKLKKRKVVA